MAVDEFCKTIIYTYIQNVPKWFSIGGWVVVIWKTEIQRADALKIEEDTNEKSVQIVMIMRTETEDIK